MSVLRGVFRSPIRSRVERGPNMRRPIVSEYPHDSGLSRSNTADLAGALSDGAFVASRTGERTMRESEAQTAVTAPNFTSAGHLPGESPHRRSGYRQKSSQICAAQRNKTKRPRPHERHSFISDSNAGRLGYKSLASRAMRPRRVGINAWD